jgi:plastocyanin
MRCAALLILAATPVAEAASVIVEVRNETGGPVADAVVYAIPEGVSLPPPARRAVLDQKNRTFVPHVLPVQTGTAVSFPNSDNVRHQVYSFSPAKKFQLPLYAGTPAAPVVFDKPGVVTLGCNIHDRMSAYVVVVDTPYFATTRSGRAELANLPEGRYVVRAWYPGAREEPPPQPVALGTGEQRQLSFRVGSQ